MSVLRRCTSSLSDGPTPIWSRTANGPAKLSLATLRKLLVSSSVIVCLCAVNPMNVTVVHVKIDTMSHPSQRIVSLVPSMTETLFAFGLGERVVAVTDYCTHPPEDVA